MKREPLGPSDGPHTATFLDPIAWERRVAEARLRRDRVLAKRDKTDRSQDQTLRCERIGRVPLPHPPLPRAALPDPEQASTENSPTAALVSTLSTAARNRAAIPLTLAAALLLGWTLIDSPTPPQAAPDTIPASVAAPAPVAFATTTPPANPDATVPLPPVAATPHQHVKLLAPAGLAPATADRAAERLRAAGFTVTGPVAVPLTVPQANARYFHEADRDGLADLLTALAPLPGPAPELRGYTDLADAPPPGHIEIWLAGPAQPPIALAGSDAQAPAPNPAAVDAALLNALVSLARTEE